MRSKSTHSKLLHWERQTKKSHLALILPDEITESRSLCNLRIYYTKADEICQPVWRQNYEDIRLFGYWDIKFLYFISQINGGLIARKQLESMESLKEGNIESSGTLEANNSVSLNLHFLSGQTSTRDAGITNIQELSKYDYGKELIEKVLHDNAVQDLIDTMKASGELKENADNLELGDYVVFKTAYDVFDINYWNTILNERAFTKMLGLETTPQQTGNREERRAKDKKSTGSNTSPEPSIPEIVSALCKFIPCPQMIMTERHAIPVDNRFLRESLHSIRFKYGSEITILGRVTNTPEKAQQLLPFVSSQLSTISIVANATFFNMALSKTQWITTPIALYFE